MRAPLLNRYITWEILPGFLVSIMVFSAIFLMARVMELANLVISKGVGLGLVLEILLLALPKVLTYTLPMATLLAVLAAFLRLSADSELTVLRASGISLYQLSPPVLVFGGLIGIITAIFTIWVTPEASWRFKTQLLDLAKTRADLAIREQVFIRDFPGLVIYIGQLPPGSDTMGEVFIHDGRSEEESTIINAKRGRLGADRDAGVLFFHLEDGEIDRVYTNKQSTDSVHFESYDLKFSAGPELDKDGTGDIFRGRSELPLGELKPVAEAKGDPAAVISYSLEWHRRLALPFTAFIMALIGLPLGASFRARGRNFALIMGLGVFIVYYVFYSIGWSLAESGLIPPVAGAWVSNVIITVLGLVLLKRINRGVPVDPMELVRRMTTGTGKPRSTSRVRS
ncbi:LPS export ABC transporter permease LptF [Deltaproteobacteria bacterium Smac51]|nr:LPS export ABC transporter permease LptF [Deltaproteobacteria bacterium Smac51]